MNRYAKAMKACVALGLLVLSAIPCCSTKLTGKVKPFSSDVVVELWYDSKYGMCDSYGGATKLDRYGRFIFDDAREGKCLIQIVPNGLRNLPKIVGKVTVASKPIDVGVIRLELSAWVTGKVSPPGRNLHVAPAPNPYTSCKSRPDGSFEVDGLTPGRHKLWVFQDDCIAQSVEVEIDGVHEYKVPPIRLVVYSSITGVIEGNLKYARRAMTETDRRHEQSQLLLAAIPADVPEPGGYGLVGTQAGIGAYVAASGGYKIPSLKPGCYDLAASGPGCIVRGVSDLPEAGTTSAADVKALLDSINVLGTEFDAKNANRVCEHISPGCIFLHRSYLPVKLETFLKNWDAFGFGPGERRELFARIGSGKAVVFTRAGAVDHKNHRTGGLEIIESWRFMRDNGEWKLTRYRSEQEMTELLSTLRISYDDSTPLWRPIEKLPHVSIVLTDDTRLSGVTVGAGKTTSGHDFDLIH